MSDITIKFIGREYTIPADVLTYIDLLNFNFVFMVTYEMKNSIKRI